MDTEEALGTVGQALQMAGQGQVIPAFPFQKVSEAWNHIVKVLQEQPDPAARDEALAVVRDADAAAAERPSPMVGERKAKAE